MRATILCSLFTLLLSGCGNGLNLVPVSGKVLLDGEPVSGAAVAFWPTSGGPIATGVTNDQGQFELSTLDKPGAIVGNYRVTVIKSDVEGGVAADADNLEASADQENHQVTWHTPEKYSDLKRTDLVKDVSANAVPILLELSAE